MQKLVYIFQYACVLFHRWCQIFTLHVVTKEGISYQFVPKPEGAHAMTLDQSTNGRMFGRNMINNLALFGSTAWIINLEWRYYWQYGNACSKRR